MMHLRSKVSLVLAMLAGGCLLLTACVAVRLAADDLHCHARQGGRHGDLPG